jgi:hypothetical protein
MIAKNLFELYKYRTLYPCLFIAFWVLLLIYHFVRLGWLVGIALIPLVAALVARKQFRRKQAAIQLMTSITADTDSESSPRS